MARSIKVVAAPALRPQELFLQIGRKRYQVASVDEAVAKYTAARDASGLGASQMPRVTIVDAQGDHLYSVSYNGRVWDIDQNGNRVALDGMNGDQWVAHVTGGA